MSSYFSHNSIRNAYFCLNKQTELNIAIEILDKIPNKNVETPNKILEENIIKAVQSIPQETYSIDIETASHAKAFLDYCNLSKIVLGGYIGTQWYQYPEH